MRKLFASAFMLFLFFTISQLILSSNRVLNLNVNKQTTHSYIRGYTPAQIQHAYGLDKIHSTGKDQKIAIIVAYGSNTLKQDIDVFNKQFNLKPIKLEIAYPSGKPKNQYINWSIETTLDVEWAHALAPEASILLVITKSTSITDFIEAVDFASSKCNIVSMSWGCKEFKEEPSYEHHFNHPNIVYISSAGDNGPEVNWPAISSNVLSVGGTTLKLDSDGNKISQETLWGGSGYGVSKYIEKPDYQLNFQKESRNPLSNSYRLSPDVSFVADPSTGVAVYCSAYADGWIVSGGTSLGASSWAALIALINEERRSPLSKIHTSLYKIASNKEIMLNTLSDKDYNFNQGLQIPFGYSVYEQLIKE